MINNFNKYPHTPHLIWMGGNLPRTDKILPEKYADEFKNNNVIVEEKLDGANLGISINDQGELLFQNRGNYIENEYNGQFYKLNDWIRIHKFYLEKFLDKNIIIFGEWLAARHSVQYDNLPDYYVVFDVFDKIEKRFWSADRRNELSSKIGLHTAPSIFEGKISIENIKKIVSTTKSKFGNEIIEGVVVRIDAADWNISKSKIVRPDFIQSIDTHWKNNKIEWNIINYKS